jgi:uncharacterized protein YyaL (SSP411 family)
MDSKNDHKYTNHLINESSPYLLQHAHNPVDWHPWGEEALQKAEEEGKMLLISVGYAACHWCHVMEHESFEDTLVAKIMNDNFVCIKVDREERPDVDDVYMTACQLTNGRGCGWPLNSFALADGRPFWAGTYFPKDKWIQVLNTFVELKQNEPEKLKDFAEKLTNGLQTAESINVQLGEGNFTAEALDEVAAKFVNQIDLKWGGRQGSPKFPMPNNYEFLLQYHHLTGNQEALSAVSVTLLNLADGGIYDQLGGGFARYSTDARWIVPHFEKMLYDNGQLVGLFSKAYRLTKNPKYLKIIDESIVFINRELSNEEGAFYSSLDADSEGKEGKFYIWTKNEIDSIVNDETQAKVFNDYYEVNQRGNWEEGNNILYRRKTADKLANKYNMSIEELEGLIEEAAAKLMKARDKRIRPGLDDKVLTSWNALMLDGIAEAYKATGNEAYRELAKTNGNFIVSKMMDKDYRLNRNYKNGKSTINAFLDDYAQTITAFINLYEITFDEKWLDHAKGLADYAIVHFFDDETKMFHYTSDLDPALIARKKEVTDNVIPGSNSTMAKGLHSLGLYLYNKEYLDMSLQMLKNVSGEFVGKEYPSFYSNWCQLYLTHVRPPYEVAIMGADFDTKRKEIMANYLPNAIFLGGDSEGKLELLKNKLPDGETMIYVCQNKVCKLPVMEVSEALGLME